MNRSAYGRLYKYMTNKADADCIAAAVHTRYHHLILTKTHAMLERLHLAVRRYGSFRSKVQAESCP